MSHQHTSNLYFILIVVYCINKRLGNDIHLISGSAYCIQCMCKDYNCPSILHIQSSLSKLPQLFFHISILILVIHKQAVCRKSYILYIGNKIIKVEIRLIIVSINNSLICPRSVICTLSKGFSYYEASLVS